jgi:Stress-induced morphogen (activity unknown)
MEPAAVAECIESELPEARVAVTMPRPNDTDHLATTVVSPAFEGEDLVDQHSLVYDSLEEHLTSEIHALKLTTYTPAEAPVDAPGVPE